MKKIVLILIMMFSFTYVVKADNLVKYSKSAILVENSTGKVLYEYNADEKLAPASMTKIMSLILIMESIDEGSLNLDDEITISKKAASMGGSQVFLEPNSKMKVEELLKSISIASANDAVVAFAEHLAGSEEEFVQLMNEKAKELNLSNSNFKNSHGLDVEEHYTSARDMSVMAIELLKHERILNYTKIYEEYLNKPDGSRTWLVNTNKLVRFYDYIDGLKTGYTSNAKYCLTATGYKNNIRLISVVMSSPTTDNRTEDTISLLQYGFSNFKVNKIIKSNEILGEIDIVNGKKEKAKIVIESDVNELVKVKDEEKKYVTKIKITNNNAPLYKGDSVGKIYVFDNNNNIIDTKEITIGENIKKANLFDLMLRNLRNIVKGII